jgi:hypothetical protein
MRWRHTPLPDYPKKATQPTTLYRQIQIRYNRVGRSITGAKIRDRISIPDLLKKAGLPSINWMVVSAICMETWNSRHSNDGGNGAGPPSLTGVRQ